VDGARREVLTRMRAHLTADGRAAIGFGANRGYDFGSSSGTMTWRPAGCPSAALVMRGVSVTCQVGEPHRHGGRVPAVCGCFSFGLVQTQTSR